MITLDAVFELGSEIKMSVLFAIWASDSILVLHIYNCVPDGFQ